jgi:hypothetical protein
MQNDPNFTMGVGTSMIDYATDRKICDKYHRKEFDPFSSSDGPIAFHD